MVNRELVLRLTLALMDEQRARKELGGVLMRIAILTPKMTSEEMRIVTARVKDQS